MGYVESGRQDGVGGERVWGEGSKQKEMEREGEPAWPQGSEGGRDEDGVRVCVCVSVCTRVCAHEGCGGECRLCKNAFTHKGGSCQKILLTL